MKTARRLAVSLVLLAFAGASFADSPGQKKAEIRKMRSETLAKLYKHQPRSKARIASAYGYAVFSNVGVNVLLISVGGGRGVARDNKSGRDVYMKMLSGGVGPGLGVKDFRGIFVFENQKAFRKFIDMGWEGGAQANAVAKAGGKGGDAEAVVTVAPGVKFYQLTETGLALEATLQGTKYFKDDDLNAGK
jgi:lipid-binding SYLF domain-containing protein